MRTASAGAPVGLLRRTLVWAYGLVAAVVVVEVADRAGLPVRALLSDPTQAAGDSVFRGALSSVFLLVWGAAGGGLLVAGAARRTGDAGFLVATGVLVLVLGVDDAALLHEEAADRLLGVGDAVVYGAYGLVGVLWLARYHRNLLRTDLVTFAAAAVGFGVSNVFDAVEWLPFRTGIEEPCKYYGLAALAVWAFRTARDALTDGPVPAEPEALAAAG